MRFSGQTYDPAQDRARLTTQYNKVFDTMVDGQWHTIPELADISGGSEAGVSARIRDMRKARFGGHTVERERVPGQKGLWRYRLTLAKDLLQ
jgi:hypothetical protein